MRTTSPLRKKLRGRDLKAIVAKVKESVRVPVAPRTAPDAWTDDVRELLKPLTTTDVAVEPMNDEADRAMGCLVGMAVGDAIGAPLEFLDAGSACGRWDRVTNAYDGEMNRFRLKRGQWTDDASMGLALADSLLSTGTFDGSDARIRWFCWWHFGYANAFLRDDDRSRSVGLGGNVGRSIDAVVPGTRPPPAFDETNTDAGNGSLMRLAAVPVRYFLDTDACLDAARQSSKATHPGILASESCAFLAFACAKAIRNSSNGGGRTFLDDVVPEYLTAYGSVLPESVRLLLESTATADDHPKEQLWNWRADPLPIKSTLVARGPRYNGYPNTASYFGSFSIDALAMALNAIYHTDSFDAAIERCVNFLGDADSTAAICGQLAGAIYGLATIPKPLTAQLYTWDHGEVAIRGLLLWASARDLLPDSS